MLPLLKSFVWVLFAEVFFIETNKGTNMATVTEEFRYLAKELSELYQKRKDIAKDIILREERLRKLGLMLEFADNMEEKLGDDLNSEVNQE